MVTTSPSHPPLLKRSKLWMACTRNRWVLLSTAWIISSPNSVPCVIIVWLCNWKSLSFQVVMGYSHSLVIARQDTEQEKEKLKKLPEYNPRTLWLDTFTFSPGAFFMECLCSLGHLGNHSLVGMGLFIFGHHITLSKTSHMSDKRSALTDLSRLGCFRMLIVASHACFIISQQSQQLLRALGFHWIHPLYLYIPNGSISQIVLFLFFLIDDCENHVCSLPKTGAKSF